MDFPGKTHKEQLEELAASIYGNVVFGAGHYTISLVPQNDSVDIFIQPHKTRIQVVRAGLSDNFYHHCAINGKIATGQKSDAFITGDVNPIPQVCGALTLKIKKQYPDANNLILLVFCEMGTAAFGEVRNGISFIKRHIQNLYKSASAFKEVWIVWRLESPSSDIAICLSKGIASETK